MSTCAKPSKKARSEPGRRPTHFVAFAPVLERRGSTATTLPPRASVCLKTFTVCGSPASRGERPKKTM